ncbi:MAG: site-specific DNA-methyltransferase [Thermaceae bacterium]|nr:site-specific DNA-methyltransferase [Thermaceae bacterium]
MNSTADSINVALQVRPVSAVPSISQSLEQKALKSSLVKPTREQLVAGDIALMNQLRAYETQDSDYWSFRGSSKRQNGHDYYQYPGMMVPQMLEKLLETVLTHRPWTTNVFDPFMGSATTLSESLRFGLNYVGVDINPLAVLLGRVKSQVVSHVRITKESERLLLRIEHDKSKRIDVDFPGRRKWFLPKAAIELSRIRRNIMAVSSRAYRRFFWVALAETIRLTSNSRTSTFKLHIRPQEELDERSVWPIEVFRDVLKNNLKSLKAFQADLEGRELITRSEYVGSSVIKLGSITQARFSGVPRSDLLLTSPPYGDNGTTIPYGESSFLPLQWIPVEDIDDNYDRNLITTTKEIDARSLGGKLKGALEAAEKVLERSASLRAVVDQLAAMGVARDRPLRVTAFYRDLDASLEPILGRMKPGGLMVWTVGRRSVAGLRIPMDDILEELLKARGAVTVGRLQRRINSKRMAVKNDISETMRSETILLMRAGFN